MKLFDLFEAPREYIAKSQGAKLVDRASEDVGEELSLDEILDQLMNADPTGRQKYLQWIVNRYLANEFKLEDVSRLRNDLDTFERIKRTLDKKDINQYKTLRDLYTVTDVKKDDDELLSNKQKKKSEYQSKRDEFVKTGQAEIVYKGPDGMLVVPKTKEASQFFGQGTRWCTAAKNDCKFDGYNKLGPLYIWLGKDGTKEQYSLDAYQMMDANDDHLPKERTKEMLNRKPLSDVVNDRIEKAFKDRDLIKLTSLVSLSGRDQMDYSDLYLQNPIYASFVAHHRMGKRWPEFEKIALENPLETSPLDVARYVGQMKISDAFVNKYLEAFKNNPVILSNFAIRSKRALPKYEPYILKHLPSAFWYENLIKKSQWPELEKAILDNPRSTSLSIIPNTDKTSYENGLSFNAQLHKTGEPAPDFSFDKSKCSDFCLHNIARYVAQYRNKSWPEYENLIKGTPLEKPYYNELNKWENGFYHPN